jgi:7-cyano-7-deazaguanine synthase
VNAVLLLSGGMDSTALAAWKRPAHCLVIDYGQQAARAEARAAALIAELLDLPLHATKVDLAQLGQGTLAGEFDSPHSEFAEFWPYRNQFLITIAAAWALKNGATEVWTGSIRTDDRHVDGSASFYNAIDALVGLQEGSIRVNAPAIELDAAELVDVSGVSDEVLSWTHSCHMADISCGQCAGCLKRRSTLARLGRLR